MTICKKCGVELETGLESCPLCQEPQEDQRLENTIDKNENPGYSPLSRKEKARLFWEISGLLHFSALTVTIILDLITSKGLSWSLYAVTCIVASFVYITLIFLGYKKLWVFLPGLLINSLGLLVLIDLFDGGIDWFVNPGLPLAGFCIVILGFVLLYSYRTRQKGFNIIAFSSLAIGIYCILAEIFISLAVSGTAKLSWSVVAGASILPFSLFLFFFHYRLKRGTSLKRFFHL